MLMSFSFCKLNYLVVPESRKWVQEALDISTNAGIIEVEDFCSESEVFIYESTLNKNICTQLTAFLGF